MGDKLKELQGLDRQLAEVDALPPKDSPRFHFVSAGEGMANLKAIDWVIKDYVERDSLGVAFGPPGQTKSFVALDMACCVATGHEWHGKPVKEGAVFVICGEGHNGIMRRLKAWSILNGVGLDDAPLFVSTASAALTDPLNTNAVTETIAGLAEAVGLAPELIVVDTVARNYGAADENSAADMGVFISNIDAHLRRRYGAAVLLVHHSGKDPSKGARGSTALKAAVDAEYEITRDELGITRMQAHKMKDAEQPEPRAFKLESVRLPLLDDEGNDVYGAALKSIDYIAPVKTGKEGRGKNQVKALAVLRELYREHEARLVEGGMDGCSARVLLDDWRDRCAFPNRQTFHKVKTSLCESGKVAVRDGYAELADE